MGIPRHTTSALHSLGHPSSPQVAQTGEGAAQVPDGLATSSDAPSTCTPHTASIQAPSPAAFAYAASASAASSASAPESARQAPTPPPRALPAPVVVLDCAAAVEQGLLPRSRAHEIMTTYGTTHCSLLTAHCSLLTAHCSLLTAHCSLLTAHCSLQSLQ